MLSNCSVYLKSLYYLGKTLNIRAFLEVGQSNNFEDVDGDNFNETFQFTSSDVRFDDAGQFSKQRECLLFCLEYKWTEYSVFL